MRCITIFLLYVFCISCEKPGPIDNRYMGHIRLDSSVYTYLYQAEGSLLLFRDSITGVLDTLHVFQSDIDTFKVSNENGVIIYEGEEWTQRERHSTTGHVFTFSTNVRNPKYYNTNIIHKSGLQNGFGNSMYIFTPISQFIGGTLYIHSNSYNKISNYYDSITFDSTYYHNVYCVKTVGETPMNYTDNLYYYAKGFGLVRWEELTNQKIWKRVF